MTSLNGNKAYVVDDNKNKIKVYDNKNQKPNILFNQSTVMAGYYNRFYDKDALYTMSRGLVTNSGYIKLSKPFSELNTGIEFVFKPENYRENLSCTYNSSSNRTGADSPSAMPSYESYRINKEDLLNNNKSKLTVGWFESTYEAQMQETNPIFITTNGVDTLYVHDINGEPTSFIGNYMMDEYLVFREIDEY